jgi:hypothetical protein
MQPDRQQHDRTRHLCYRPAVFFRSFREIALSFTEGNLRLFKNVIVLSFKNMGSYELA